VSTRIAKTFFSAALSSVKIQVVKIREDAKVMGRAVDSIMINIFEPCLNWALSHPIVSVVVVGALIFFACRNYKML